MPKKKTGRQITIPKISIPTRLNQQQILYTLLLIAVFLLGYLFATVQALRNPSSKTETAPTAQQPAAQQPTVAPAIDAKSAVEKLGSGHLPIKGDKNAKVTIVEFSDFECPFCARFYSDTLTQIISTYVDTGKVKIDYRHYPLPFHPQAKPLAIASECANDQGKFWEMHDKIFATNTAGGITGATADTYKQWAVDIGLDAATFNSCYDAQKHTDIITKDTSLGSSVGVSGTPTFYINGRQLVGAVPFDSFKTIIEDELAK